MSCTARRGCSVFTQSAALSPQHSPRWTPAYSLPPVDDLALQAAVAAILNLGGDVLPAPFNTQAQKEARSKIPVAEHTAGINQQAVLAVMVGVRQESS